MICDMIIIVGKTYATSNKLNDVFPNLTFDC